MATDDPALQASAPPPDLMNGPVFNPSSKGKQRSLDDVDTCRICRGEGSREEPLFYPCKCSGSIKFVHQNCLMEWLSHSQKKHCELCKTPFRFTKLYHPHMPSSVPLPVFLRRAAIHTWKTFLTWARFHLVLFVWVAWLPWCMRTVWRGLFWIGDGGWINWQKIEEQALVVAKERLDELAAEGTSPASAQLLISKSATASAVVSQVANVLPQFMSPISQRLNFTGGPIFFSLAKRLMTGVIGRISPETPLSQITSTVKSTNFSNINRHSSWLSEFRFLNSLTRSPMFNKLLIDTLEGQLITLLVVIAFILIFLIREWVVQQHPGMNMGGAPNANPPIAQRAEAPNGEQIAQQNAHQLAEQRLQAPHQAALIVPLGEQAGELAIAEPPNSQQDTPPLPEETQNVRTQAHSTNLEESTIKGDSPMSSQDESSSNLDTTPLDTEQFQHRTNVAGPAMSPQRPGMPNRDMARSAEIRRTLEEQLLPLGHKGPVFMELWNRAENKPSEVLKIIEEEGRMDELSWIVNAMRVLENSSSIDGDQDNTSQAALYDVPTETKSNEIGYGLDNASQTPSLQDGEAIMSVGVEDDKTNEGTQNQEIDFENSGSGQLRSRDTLYHPEEERKFHADDQSESQSSEVVHEFDTAQTPRASLLPSNSQQLRDWAPESQSNSSAGSTDHPNNNPFHPGYLEQSENHDDAPITGAAADAPELVRSSENEAESSSGPRIEPDDTSQEMVLQEHQNIVVVHHGLFDNMMNWLWGGIDPLVDLPVGNPDPEGGDDEHIVNNLADEAPFIPVEHGRPIIAEDDDAENAGNVENLENAENAENPVQGPEALGAAAQAGADPNGGEAADDGEDLEGIMELIGMQGPLAGLIQNGMICAVLVSMTIILGMWIPYIAGKIFLVFLANPVSLLFKLPLRWASISADLIIDLSVFSAGCAFYWVDTVVRLLCAPIGWMFPSIERISRNKILAETAKFYAESAMERLAKAFVITGGSLSESDIPAFSIIAHESLRLIEYRVSYMTQIVRSAIIALVKTSYFHTFDFGEVYQWLSINITANAREISLLTRSKAREIITLAPQLFEINPLRVSLNIPQRTAPLDYTLAYWNTKDRVLAIVFGYMFFSVIGMLYLRISAFLRGRDGRGKFDGIFADILYQAGGVLKVILIISIEMIVFPLYCGFLLDLALMPLFGNVTIISRVNFLMESPNTSLFVHWFVGTCYMFHFALFVSMCRKIMRNGVLCK